MKYFVARWNPLTGLDIIAEDADDSYVDDWLELDWPELPDGQVPLARRDSLEYAVVIPDGRIIVFENIDTMWEQWKISLSEVI